MSDIMKDIGKVMELTAQEFQRETGRKEMQIGEQIVTVFNNGTLILSMEEDWELRTQVVMGKPFMLDFTVGEE